MIDRRMTLPFWHAAVVSFGRNLMGACQFHCDDAADDEQCRNDPCRRDTLSQDGDPEDERANCTDACPYRIGRAERQCFYRNGQKPEACDPPSLSVPAKWKIRIFLLLIKSHKIDERLFFTNLKSFS